MVQGNKGGDNRRGDQGQDHTEGQGVEGDVGLEDVGVEISGESSGELVGGGVLEVDVNGNLAGCVE